MFPLQLAHCERLASKNGKRGHIGGTARITAGASKSRPCYIEDLYLKVEVHKNR